MICPARQAAAIQGETMIAYAFPFVQGAERSEGGAKPAHSQGMTLKDWFAGQIIAALLGSDPANSSQRDKNGQLCPMDPSKLANMAKSAYQAAEALMQARAAEQSGP
jgi:hypothetical protein